MELTIEELMKTYDPYLVYIDTDNTEVRFYNTPEKTFSYRNGEITPMDNYEIYDIYYDTISEFTFNPIKKVVYKDSDFKIPIRYFLEKFEDLFEEEKEPFFS